MALTFKRQEPLHGQWETQGYVAQRAQREPVQRGQSGKLMGELHHSKDVAMIASRSLIHSLALEARRWESHCQQIPPHLHEDETPS